MPGTRSLSRTVSVTYSRRRDARWVYRSERSPVSEPEKGSGMQADSSVPNMHQRQRSRKQLRKDICYNVTPLITSQLNMTEILSVLKQDIRPKVRATSETGRRGEQLAAEYLEADGYRLVLSNFTVPVGRNTRGVAVTGEIDIVAVDGDTLCFVEVKTRTSDEFAAPIATVTLRKQRQITRTARIYRRIFGLRGMPYRYDIVSLVLPKNEEPKIELVKGFWSESKF